MKSSFMGCVGWVASMMLGTRPDANSVVYLIIKCINQSSLFVKCELISENGAVSRCIPG